MTHHDELIGGCCVCSDDQGFSNNALVYCDGKGCTVACHTACYGIVSIPDGDWYCRRCEIGEIQAPCRLCPLTEGAMKQTSDGDWAHVICALYIPEVSFGNDETMEPIILSNIPSIRFGQTCSICIKNGRSKSMAVKGACCECTYKNCSQSFHVTCAQQAGLLYEDVRKNNCQYPIYCESHRPKFSKFIRQIPPFQYHSSQKNQTSKQKEVSSESLNSTKNKRNMQANELSSSSPEKRKLSEATSQNSLQIISENNLSSINELQKEDHTINSSSTQSQSIADISNESATVRSKSLDGNNNQQSSTSTCRNISSNDKRNSSSKESLTSKIKIEANEIDYQIIDKMNADKDKQSHKKRHHSNEDGPRPVGRPPSKRLLLSQSKSYHHSTLPQPNSRSVEPQTKNDQTNTNLQSRSSTHASSITVKPVETSFPPQTLEEFLEQEWESTSDFILQQHMPNDVSSLLACLYQFKSENATLKKKFDELKHRRDSLRVINANLRRKLSDAIAINNNSNPSSCLPSNNQKLQNRSKSPIHESQPKSNKIIPPDMNFVPHSFTLPLSSSSSTAATTTTTTTAATSSLPYPTFHPYVINKTEPLPLTHGLSLELLSQVLTNSGPQFFAPTWNISNFGYASFPGANAISLSDESLIRSYASFQQ